MGVEQLAAHRRAVPEARRQMLVAVGQKAHRRIDLHADMAALAHGVLHDIHRVLDARDATAPGDLLERAERREVQHTAVAEPHDALHDLDLIGERGRRAELSQRPVVVDDLGHHDVDLALRVRRVFLDVVVHVGVAVVEVAQHEVQHRVGVDRLGGPAAAVIRGRRRRRSRAKARHGGAPSLLGRMKPLRPFGAALRLVAAVGTRQLAELFGDHLARVDLARVAARLQSVPGDLDARPGLPVLLVAQVGERDRRRRIEQRELMVGLGRDLAQRAQHVDDPGLIGMGVPHELGELRVAEVEDMAVRVDGERRVGIGIGQLRPAPRSASRSRRPSSCPALPPEPRARRAESLPPCPPPPRPRP